MLTKEAVQYSNNVVGSPASKESQVAEKTYTFDQTIEFIEKALGEEAHFKKPHTTQEKNRKRDLDITLTYLLSPGEETQEKIGSIFGFDNRQRINQIVTKTVRQLWLNSSSVLQEEFPLHKLILRKPHAIKTKETVISSQDRLAQKNKELVQGLQNAKTDEEKQELLNQINIAQYRKLVRGDNPILLSLAKVARRAGLHAHPRNFHILYDAIKITRFPLGEIHKTVKADDKEITQSYYFMYYTDEKRAKEILLKNEKLKPFLRHPVRQIAGPQENAMPSTTNIRDKNKFRTIGGLMFRMGIVPGTLKRQFRSEVRRNPDFPVPIFDFYGSNYYPVNRESEVANVINQWLDNILKHPLTNS